MSVKKVKLSEYAPDWYEPRTSFFERLVDTIIAERARGDTVTLRRAEVLNIMREPLKDGYDPYNTAPVWASWLKVAPL